MGSSDLEQEEGLVAGGSPSLKRGSRARPAVNYAEESHTETSDEEYVTPPPSKKMKPDSSVSPLTSPQDSDGSGSNEEGYGPDEVTTPVTTPVTKSKRYQVKRKLAKVVPYQPVTIPFGIDEVETLLSYRKLEDREEFLVKFKHQSLHHVRWLTLPELETKMNQFKYRTKKLLEQFHLDPTKFFEPVNPVYLHIDRVLDEGEVRNKKVTQVYLLVKWSGLPYENSTWETVEKARELDEVKVKEFYDRQRVPDFPASYVPRPNSQQFIQLETSPIYSDNHQLRDYQLEGLNWLNYCYHHQRSCIMADEMGLGKTVQSVTFLNQVYNQSNVKGPFIVVAPLSTIPHWEREFRGWTQLNTIVYHGSVTSRNLIVDCEFYYKDSDGVPITDRYKFDVLITSYEMLGCGQAQLKPIQWRVAIFDEAHRLKNSKSKLQQVLSWFHFEHRVLLTGTPLQNSVVELFNLLKFLDPERFNNEMEFLAKYRDLKTCSEVTELQELLKPLMLRRFKEDVEKSIPDKEETVIEVELTRTQKAWYRAILERNFTWIQRGGGRGAEGPSLNNIMMELRKCCNHPFLIKGAEDQMVLEEQVSLPDQYTRVLIEASGKLVLLDKLLPRLKADGHKVLIFSQMTRVLDLLTEYLARREYPYERIDGNVKPQDRQLAIDRYSTQPSSFIFLLCTRAGGVGINLTAADTVVIFDSDWNPQNDIQAQARAHRIGQTKPVKIYRLLCKNTYERQMFDRANLKLGLDKAVMQKMTGALTDSDPGLSKNEVEELLKLGAYGALLDDDESNQFCGEDIDHILERRTLVVRQSGHQKGSAFSKASFSTLDNDTTDLNDPDFWNKWAAKAKAKGKAKANLNPQPLPITNPLIIDHPRTRKRATRFDSLSLNTVSNQGLDSNSDSQYSSYSDDGLDHLEADSEFYPANSRVWRTDERSKLERGLMIYGFNHWESFHVMLPKRTVQDIRSCALHHVLFLLDHPNFSKCILPADLPGIESDVRAAIAADCSRHDPSVDWEQLLLIDKIPYPDASEQQVAEFQSYLHLAPASITDRISRKPKALFYRLQVLYRICEVIVPSDPVKCSQFKPPHTNSLVFPTPWWNEEADRDILIGIKRHGYLQFSNIRSDPDLSFSQRSYVDDIANVTDDQVLWPSWGDIGARVRRVISGFFSSVTKAGKHLTINGGKSTAKPSPNQDSSPRLGLDRINSWFPKPLKGFLLILSSFGVENQANFSVRSWDQFRSLSDLHKRTDRDLDSLLYLTIKNYVSVLQSDSAREVRLRNASVLVFGQNLLQLLPPCTDPLPASWVSPTPEKAKRLIKRIMQLDEFRKLVVNIDLSFYLASINRMPGFPSWWEPQLHNKPFVTALLRYGIASFNHLVRDDSLPFTHAQPNEWPKESQVMNWIERVIFLHNVAIRANNSSKLVNTNPVIIQNGYRGQFPSRLDHLGENNTIQLLNHRPLVPVYHSIHLNQIQPTPIIYPPNLQHITPRLPSNRHSVNGSVSSFLANPFVPQKFSHHDPNKLKKTSELHQVPLNRNHVQNTNHPYHSSPVKQTPQRPGRHPTPRSISNKVPNTRVCDEGRQFAKFRDSNPSTLHNLDPSPVSSTSSDSDSHQPIKLKLHVKPLQKDSTHNSKNSNSLRSNHPQSDNDITSSLTPSPSDLHRALHFQPTSPVASVSSLSPIPLSPPPNDSPLTSYISNSED